jgi:predicted phage-related endonuclease
LRDPELRFGATPDFYILRDSRGLGVLQAKSVLPDVLHDEWNDGKVVPFWIQLQALSEMILTDAAFGVVAALVEDGYKMPCHVYPIARHPAAEAQILERVREFWKMVEENREPEPDYAKDVTRETKDKVIDLSGDNELPDLLQQRALISKEIDAFTARKEQIETIVKSKLRDAERAVGLVDWNVSWKTVHYQEYTVPAKDTRRLFIRRRS